MRISYIHDGRTEMVELKDGSLLLVLEPDEPHLQDMFVRALIPLAEGVFRGKLEEIQLYTCYQHEECDG